MKHPVLFKCLLALVLCMFFSLEMKAFGTFINYDVTVTANTNKTGVGKVYVEESGSSASFDWDETSSATVSRDWVWYGIGMSPISHTFNLYAKVEADGYEFKGWGNSIDATSTTSGDESNNNQLSITLTDDDASRIPVGGRYKTNVTRYAIFSPINYSITYNTDGGTLSPSGSPQTYNIESTSTIKSASKNGYSFDGWEVTTTDGIWPAVGSTVNSGVSLTGKYGNLTLKALWTPLLADLTITVTGLDSNDSAIYTISSGGTVLYTVVVPGSSPSVTVKNLPTGVNYNVNPKAEWCSWKYEGTNATETFALGASGHTCSFTYSKKSSVKKHDEQQNVNWKQ